MAEPAKQAEQPAEQPKQAEPLEHPTIKSKYPKCEQYRPLLEQYDWNIETMMYAMWEESKCEPHKVGDNYPINGLLAVSCGLLQVRALAGRPSCEALKDPALNVSTSYKIWKEQGYYAWSTLHKKGI